MKYLITFVFLTATLWLAPPALVAQDKGDLTPLAANASLDETQKWLVKAIGKNNTFSVKNTKNKTKNSIADIKFNGCQLSYRIVQETMIEALNLPQMSTQSGGTSGSQGENIMRSELIFNFALKNIDPAGVTLNDLPTDAAQLILLKVVGDNKLVNYKNNPGTQNAREGTQASAYMNIKKTVAGQIRDGLVQAIKLCGNQ